MKGKHRLAQVTPNVFLRNRKQIILCNYFDKIKVFGWQAAFFSYEVVLVLQTPVQVLIFMCAGTMGFDKATHTSRAEYFCVCWMKGLCAPLAWRSICLHPLYGPMNFWSLTFKHLWKRFFSYIYLLVMLLTCLRSGYFWNWRFCEALTKLLLASFYSCIHPNIRGELGWYLNSTLMWLVSNTFSWKRSQTWIFTDSSPSKKVPKISFYVYKCFSSLFKEYRKKNYHVVTTGSKLYIRFFSYWSNFCLL